MKSQLEAIAFTRLMDQEEEKRLIEKTREIGLQRSGDYLEGYADCILYFTEKFKQRIRYGR